jgi:hypothetical protein
MDLFRERAPWMNDVDDRILETLAVYDGLRLFPLQQRLAREDAGEPPISYVLLRCKRLREYRLVSQRDGYFRLTDTGSAYLDGDVDAATLTHGDEAAVTDGDGSIRPPSNDDDGGAGGPSELFEE